MKKKILFFTPFFGRSGSEVVMYNLISNINRDLFDVALVTREDGQMLRRLDHSIPVHTYSPDLLTNSNKQSQFISKLYARYQSHVWYINTLVQHYIVKSAKMLNIPCIVHTHEMEEMLGNLHRTDVQNLIDYPRLIISCSKANGQVYRVLGRKKPHEVCYPCIDMKEIKTNSQRSVLLREEMGVKQSDFLWAMSGRDDNNKDPVFFVDFARELLEYAPNARFCWIGGRFMNGYSTYAMNKARFLGIDDKITWVGHQDGGYYDYLNAIDGFVLTSGRDSFSLVVLEALSLGKPVIASDNGGVREQVKSNMGIVVNHRTPVDMAKAALEVMINRQRFEESEMTENARQYDVSIQVKKWENILLKYS